MHCIGVKEFLISGTLKNVWIKKRISRSTLLHRKSGALFRLLLDIRPAQTVSGTHRAQCTQCSFNLVNKQILKGLVHRPQISYTAWDYQLATKFSKTSQNTKEKSNICEIFVLPIPWQCPSCPAHSPCSRCPPSPSDQLCPPSPPSPPVTWQSQVVEWGEGGRWELRRPQLEIAEDSAAQNWDNSQLREIRTWDNSRAREREIGQCWYEGHLGWGTTWTLPPTTNHQPQKQRSRLFCLYPIFCPKIAHGLILYCSRIIPEALSDYFLCLVHNYDPALYF